MPGDGHCIANCFAVHFEENHDKILDKLDTEFRIDLQKYRQFSECSTDKIVKEVHDYITIKRYNNDTADMFLYAFANIYQTEGKQCWNRHSLQLQSVVKNKQETTTTNFDDQQVAEDEISENCNIIDT